MAEQGVKGFSWGLIIGVAVASSLVALIFFGDRISGLLERAAGDPAAKVEAATPAPAVPTPEPFAETPEQALQRIIASKKIVNVHEHAQGPTVTQGLLEMMDKNGIETTCLMGSSKFTLTLKESVGFADYDVNNEALLQMQLAQPDRFEAWPTINPLDPQKLEKISSLIQRGAKGVKLYLGHGYVRNDTGNYMFHTVAMDDPDLEPFFAYCEKNFVPLCLHVNPYLKGFAQELVNVLTKHPDMKVNCPHFILSSINQDRLMEFLDTFPNVYSDISFGHDDFLRQGMQRITKDPAKFKALFNRYPNRFFFGTDLVLTDYEGKTPEWMQVRVQAYFDLLTKADYTTSLLPGETQHGIELRGPLLDGVLYKNFNDFLALKPQGTKLTHEISWDKMGIEFVDRVPGQAFPPQPKKPKGTTKKKPFDPVGSINRSLKDPLPQ